MDTKNFNIIELSNIECQSIEGGSNWIGVFLGIVCGVAWGVVEAHGRTLSGMGVEACDAVMMM